MPGGPTRCPSADPRQLFAELHGDDPGAADGGAGDEEAWGTLSQLTRRSRLRRFCLLRPLQQPGPPGLETLSEATEEEGPKSSLGQPMDS